MSSPSSTVLRAPGRVCVGEQLHVQSESRLRASASWSQHTQHTRCALRDTTAQPAANHSTCCTRRGRRSFLWMLQSPARLTTENSNACNKTGIFVANVKRWKRLPISWPICGAYCILQHTARARSSILNHDYYSTFSVDSVRSSAAFVSRAVLIRQCSEAEGCVRCFFAPRASLLAAPPRRCCVLAAASCRAASSRSQRTLISSQA